MCVTKLVRLINLIHPCDIIIKFHLIQLTITSRYWPVCLFRSLFGGNRNTTGRMRASLSLLLLQLWMTDASFMLSKQAELSANPPFGAMLAHYSQYGAIDVHDQSVAFCRREPHQNAAIWSKKPNNVEDWQFTAKLRIRGETEGGTVLPSGMLKMDILMDRRWAHQTSGMGWEYL